MRLLNTGDKSNIPLQQNEVHISMKLLNTGEKSNSPQLNQRGDEHEHSWRHRGHCQGWARPGPTSSRQGWQKGKPGGELCSQIPLERWLLMIEGG